ncbi:ABC transporter permease [Skermanella pratensis]|uniref:ABC transporter permease n=1 Tax=Skermanella pratensis TaxID=2233999 RepID=UPI001300F0E8|nr:ABC transporter permease [Skermanella pratensis]
MLRFLGRRVLLVLVTLAVASVLIFAITNVLPGDVGRIILGPFAPQDAVERLNAELGADRPVAVRYAEWLAGVVRGDWGRSYAFDTAVFPLVAERLGRSLTLAGSGLAVLVPLAVAAGVAAARREGGLFDRVLSVAGLAVGALPEFVTGVLLILVFGIWLGWLPIQALPPEGAGPLTVAAHLVLPVGCLVLLLFAYLFRMTRASMIEALAADYTRTAVLKGLPQRTVIRRHVLRNALLPTITVIGAQIGWLVGGLVVVETLFKYPGIGSLIHFAATNKDIPLLVGCSLAITFVFALGNLAADLLYAALNPRVRHGRNAH